MKYHKLFGWMSMVVIILVLSCLIGFDVRNAVTSVQAQSDKKIIKLAPTIKSQIKIAKLKFKGQNQNFDEAFSADPDWVRNISFNLENTSDKPIIYLSANINFPETRSTGNLMSYTKSFGQHPVFKLKDKQLLRLEPQEIIEVSLESEKDKIYRFVSERQPVESIHEVELEIGFIIFEDGTAWNAGTFMRQDLNDPKTWIPIENDSPRSRL